MKRTITALAAGGLLLTGCSASDGDPTERIIAACHDKVVDELQYPGSAQFGEDVEVGPSESQEEFQLVSGWVDSQNGFGALGRSNYSCSTYVRNDGGVTAKVESIRSAR